MFSVSDPGRGGRGPVDWNGIPGSEGDGGRFVLPVLSGWTGSWLVGLEWLPGCWIVVDDEFLFLLRVGWAGPRLVGMEASCAGLIVTPGEVW